MLPGGVLMRRPFSFHKVPARQGSTLALSLLLSACTASGFLEDPKQPSAPPSMVTPPVQTPPVQTPPPAPRSWGPPRVRTPPVQTPPVVPPPMQTPPPGGAGGSMTNTGGTGGPAPQLPPVMNAPPAMTLPPARVSDEGIPAEV